MSASSTESKVPSPKLEGRALFLAAIASAPTEEELRWLESVAAMAAYDEGVARWERAGNRVVESWADEQIGVCRRPKGDGRQAWDFYGDHIVAADPLMVLRLVARIRALEDQVGGLIFGETAGATGANS